jgi:CHAT domain-containing protein
MARGPIVEDQPAQTSPTQPDYTLPYYWAPFVLIGEW